MLRLAVGQVSDGYSPPEFYGTSDNVGPWSDIYGLGATFYKLITGVKVPIATDRSKSDNYIPAANWITDGYSSAFLELIDNSLRLSASDRPQSISSLKRLLPDIKNLSSGFSINKDLLGKSPKLETRISTTLHWKAVGIVSVILVIILGVFASLNRPAEAVLEVEAPKVSPIVIDNEPVVIENPVVTPKNVVQMPTGNAALQQALTYLTRVSSSPEISWYSIPQTEQASRSFKFVKSEIDKKIDLAIERKNFVYNEVSKEYLFKDILLSEINSFSLIASSAQCSYGPIGPVIYFCKRAGRDFRCRRNDLSIKYEHICLSTFSVL
jgi:serine/threonine protein kinase